MIGSLFAGTEEAPGEVILFQGRSYKSYRGMGSMSAMKKVPGTATSRRRGRPEIGARGDRGARPLQGSLAMNVFQLVGGLRSGMGYTAATTSTSCGRRRSSYASPPLACARATSTTCK